MAHIGFGIQGNEGNQAAAFSDYAITRFKDLHRLILWHGRNFAQKAAHFSMWFMFKSMIFAAVLGFFQFYNGFSGLNFIPNFLVAMFGVSTTTIAIYFYMLLDQDVSFKDILPENDHMKGKQEFDVDNLLPKLYNYKIETHLGNTMYRFI